MKNIRETVLLIAIILITGLCPAQNQVSPTTGASLAGEWRYIQVNLENGGSVDLDDSAWKKINLPEQEITDPAPVTWLRRTIMCSGVPADKKDSYGLRVLFNYIDGDYEVFWNSSKIGECRGWGVTSSGNPKEFPVSPELIRFESGNVLSVRVSGPAGTNSGINFKAPLAVSELSHRYLLAELEESAELIQQWKFRTTRLSGYLDFSKTTLISSYNEMVMAGERASEYYAKGNYPACRQALKEGAANRASLEESSEKIDILISSGETVKNIRDWQVVFGISSKLKADQEIHLNSAKVEYARLLNLFNEPDSIEKMQKSGEIIDKLAVLTQSRYVRDGYGFPLEPPYSYGRYGNYYFDGLMSCNVTPFKIESPDKEWSLSFFDGYAEKITVPEIDRIAKSMEVNFNLAGETGIYTVSYSQLNPAVWLETPMSGITLRGTTPAGRANPTWAAYKCGSETRTVDLLKDKTTDFRNYRNRIASNWILFWWGGGDGSDRDWPVLVLLKNKPVSMTYSKNDGIRLEFEDDEAGAIAMMPLYGIQSVESKVTGKWKDGLSTLATELCGNWSGRLTEAPWNYDEYFTVNTDKNQVEIYNILHYRKLNDKWSTTPEKYAPFPPQLSLAASKGYPAVLPENTDLGYFTKWGPLSGVKNNEIISYRLPIPPLGDDALCTVNGSKDLKEKINSYVTDIGTPMQRNAVDRVYKGRTHALMAWNYLIPEKREMLINNSRESVPAGFSDDVWYSGTEKFTGMEYYWTYFLEGPIYDLYDIDWGNGLPIYGLYKYCLYTGDWGMAEKLWPDVERAYDYFTQVDNWDWMTNSNAPGGGGTGAGDCLTVSYITALSYARMAKVLDYDIAYHQGLYRASRIAVPAVARLMMNYYLKNDAGYNPKNSMVVGLLEDEPTVWVTNGQSDPWHLTSLVSGNGAEPEMMKLYKTHAGEEFKDFLRDFDNGYPQWFNGKHEYPFGTTYKNNSGYITLPQIYARAWQGATRKNMLEWLESAEQNQYLWWQAPMVIAKILDKKSPLQIDAWAPATMVDADYTGGVITLVFEPGKYKERIPRWGIQAVCQVKPKSITVHYKGIEGDAPEELPYLSGNVYKNKLTGWKFDKKTSSIYFKYPLEKRCTFKVALW